MSGYCFAAPCSPVRQFAGIVQSQQVDTGVLLRKRDNGKWSSPAFFTLGELSVGLQVGTVVGPFAFVLLNDKAIQRFTQRINFSVGADPGLAVANWTRVARGSIGNGNVIAWSSARAIFTDVAAVSVDDIRYDEKMTDADYHRKLSANDVLSDHVSDNQVQGLQQALGPVSAPNK
ncbi:hypothetical protein GQ37_014320 [Janthinobacterium sp. BJB1]|nr:hypothetical protein GQ37_014320 [Janthinobacterium sp. BJB1]